MWAGSFHWVLHSVYLYSLSFLRLFCLTYITNLWIYYIYNGTGNSGYQDCIQSLFGRCLGPGWGG